MRGEHDVPFNFCPTSGPFARLRYDCDPLTVIAIVSAVTGTAAAVEAQDQGRRAKDEADKRKKETAAREAELAREAAAKEAAKKKAETAGQRAGFGDPSAPSTRSTFTSSANAGTRGQGGTGFNNVSEDNIGRATLFGN